MEDEIIFLVDSNIWLERLLDQKKSDEVKQFLDQVPSSKLSISDFSLHSIGVILFHLGRQNVFNLFIKDIFNNGDVHLFFLEGKEHEEISEVVKTQGLDFDDAYQYVIAKKNNFLIVSFDKDFKKTDIMVLDPLKAIEKFKK